MTDNSTNLGFLLAMFAFQHDRGPENVAEFEAWFAASDIVELKRTYYVGWKMSEAAETLLDIEHTDIVELKRTYYAGWKMSEAAETLLDIEHTDIALQFAARHQTTIHC
jgi:sulfur relay (sulfurtransferase) DsrC/TusE family protein